MEMKNIPLAQQIGQKLSQLNIKVKRELRFDLTPAPLLKKERGS